MMLFAAFFVVVVVVVVVVAAVGGGDGDSLIKFIGILVGSPRLSVTNVAYVVT